MALITLQEAIDHLRITMTEEGGSPASSDPRYNDLVAKVAEAQAIVLDYLEMDEANFAESGVSDNWLPVVKSAVKLVLSALWEDREGTGVGDYLAEDGAVVRLLRRIRTPTVA
jgi:hypothetical protein